MDYKASIIFMVQRMPDQALKRVYQLLRYLYLKHGEEKEKSPGAGKHSGLGKLPNSIIMEN